MLVSAGDRSVWLEAVDPLRGRVIWKLPYGFSLITPGVVAAPVASGGVVLDLAPLKRGSPWVRLEGISVATGKPVWLGHGTILVQDAPTACPSPLGARAFCLTAATGPTRADLFAVFAQSGIVAADIPQIGRLLTDGPGLYESSASTPTLDEIEIPGGIRWAEPVTRLFGPGFNPNFGWKFDQYGPIGVGTVGLDVPAGRPKTSTFTVPLGGNLTVGFYEASGERRWTLPGLFQCGGGLQLHGPYLCLLTGSARESVSGTFAPSKNATITLEGFDPATGEITWRDRIGDLKDVVEGNVAIKDADDLVVTSTSGQKRVLDLKTGTTTPAAANQTFWCAHMSTFLIQPTQAVTDDRRIGSSFYEPCDDVLRPIATASTTQPPTITGTTIGKTHIWATGHELKSSRKSAPKHPAAPIA